MSVFSDRLPLSNAILGAISAVMLTGLGVGAYFDTTAHSPSLDAEHYAVAAAIAVRQQAYADGYAVRPRAVSPAAIRSAMDQAFPDEDSGAAGNGVKAIAHVVSGRTDGFRLRMEGLDRERCESMLDFAVSGRASQAGVLETAINEGTRAYRRCLPVSNTVDTFWRHSLQADTGQRVQHAGP